MYVAIPDIQSDFGMMNLTYRVISWALSYILIDSSSMFYCEFPNSCRRVLTAHMYIFSGYYYRWGENYFIGAMAMDGFLVTFAILQAGVAIPSSALACNSLCCQQATNTITPVGGTIMIILVVHILSTIVVIVVVINSINSANQNYFRLFKHHPNLTNTTCC